MAGWSLSGLWHAELDTVCPDYTSRVYASKSNITFRYALLETDNYDTGLSNSGSLISPSIYIGSGKSLRFSSWSDTECQTASTTCGYDEKTVHISINGGADWALLGQVFDNPAWSEIEFNLDAYAGQNALFRFSFDTIDLESNYYPGWYVDDARVETKTP